MCVCECLREKMGEMGEDNELLIPSYLSKAKSASANQLALPLPVSSPAFSRYLSLPLSLSLSLALFLSCLLSALRCILHLLCISVHLEVILGHSCLEQTHLSECRLPVRPTRLTLHYW